MPAEASSITFWKPIKTLILGVFKIRLCGYEGEGRGGDEGGRVCENALIREELPSSVREEMRKQMRRGSGLSTVQQASISNNSAVSDCNKGCMQERAGASPDTRFPPGPMSGTVVLRVGPARKKYTAMAETLQKRENSFIEIPICEWRPGGLVGRHAL